MEKIEKNTSTSWSAVAWSTVALLIVDVACAAIAVLAKDLWGPIRTHQIPTASAVIFGAWAGVAIVLSVPSVRALRRDGAKRFVPRSLLRALLERVG